MKKMKARVATLGVAAALTAGVVVLASAGTGAAWQTAQSASASCVDGQVVINANFTNTEPGGDEFAMDVSAALQGGSSLSPASRTIQPGSSGSFTLNTGSNSFAGGTVVFSLLWSNGNSGSDTREATVNAVECPNQSQPTANYEGAVDCDGYVAGYGHVNRDGLEGDLTVTVNGLPAAVNGDDFSFAGVTLPLDVVVMIGKVSVPVTGSTHPAGDDCGTPVKVVDWGVMPQCTGDAYAFVGIDPYDGAEYAVLFLGDEEISSVPVIGGYADFFVTGLPVEEELVLSVVLYSGESMVGSFEYEAFTIMTCDSPYAISASGEAVCKTGMALVKPVLDRPLKEGDGFGFALDSADSVNVNVDATVAANAGWVWDGNYLFTFDPILWEQGIVVVPTANALDISVEWQVFGPNLAPVFEENPPKLHVSFAGCYFEPAPDTV